MEPEGPGALLIVVVRHCRARLPRHAVSRLEQAPEGVVPGPDGRIPGRNVRGVREEPRFRVAVALLRDMRTVHVRDPGHRPGVRQLTGAVHVASGHTSRRISPVQRLIDGQEMWQVMSSAVDEIVTPLDTHRPVRDGLEGERRREEAIPVVDHSESPKTVVWGAQEAECAAASDLPRCDRSRTRHPTRRGHRWRDHERGDEFRNLPGRQKAGPIPAGRRPEKAGSGHQIQPGARRRAAAQELSGDSSWEALRDGERIARSGTARGCDWTALIPAARDRVTLLASLSLIMPGALRARCARLAKRAAPTGITVETSRSPGISAGMVKMIRAMSRFLPMG